MTNIEENLKRLKINSYAWKCPKCQEKIGPEMTEQKVIEKAKEHLSSEHGE